MDEGSAEYLQITSYIDSHPIAIVGTINDDGTPHASAVYIFNVSHHTVCFVTRNLTRKYQNIFDRPEVSLTIYDDHDVSTLQANGQAFIANDEHMLTYAQQKIEQMYKIRADTLSPIDKMEGSGDFVLIGVELHKAKLTTYQGIDTNMDEAYLEVTIGS